MTTQSLLKFGALAFGILSLSACSSEEEQILDPSGKSSVEVTVNIPVEFSIIGGESTRATRPYGTETSTRLRYAVYVNDGNDTGDFLFEGNQSFTGTKTPLILQLANGKTYDLILWADAPDSPYTFDAAGKKVTVDYSKMNGSTSNGDAFYYKYDNLKADAAHSGASVTLTRQVAAVNIVTSGMDASATNYSKGVYTSASFTANTVFSLIDGTISQPQSVTTMVTEAPKDQTLTVAGTDYSMLSTLYMLAPAEVTTTDLIINTYNGAPTVSGTGIGATVPAALNTIPVNAVSIRRNYVTNIFGSLLKQ